MFLNPVVTCKLVIDNSDGEGLEIKKFNRHFRNKDGAVKVTHPTNKTFFTYHEISLNFVNLEKLDGRHDFTVIDTTEGQTINGQVTSLSGVESQYQPFADVDESDHILIKFDNSREVMQSFLDGFTSSVE